MKTSDNLIQELIEKRTLLNELQQQSPEIADALKVADDYYALLNELKEQCKGQTPQIIPYPVPYPSYPNFFYPKITCSTHTQPGTVLQP